MAPQWCIHVVTSDVRMVTRGPCSLLLVAKHSVCMYHVGCRAYSVLILHMHEDEHDALSGICGA